MRNLDRNRAHISQTGPLHFVGRPRDGLVESLRSAKPVADPVAQIFQPIQAGIVFESCIDQPVGGIAIRLDASRVGCMERSGENAKNYQAKHPNHFSTLKLANGQRRDRSRVHGGPPSNSDHRL